VTPLPAYFVEAIRANPDDDAPRLAAADWLEENGQPERGELIRVQCELARLGGNWIDFAVGPHAADYPEFEDERNWRAVTDRMAGRERELLADHGYPWLDAGKPTPTCVVRCGRESGGWAWSEHGVWTIGVEWVRGFVGAIHARAADWMAHGDALLAAHPVTEVRLTTWPDDIPPPGSLYGLGLAECVPVMLGYFWPQVRSWHLPPAPGDPYAAARELGHALERRRTEQFWDAYDNAR
jgi:uncharacterized protein (TIGR02996 family)